MANDDYPEYLRARGFRRVATNPKTGFVDIRGKGLSTGQFQNMIHNQRRGIAIATPEQIHAGLHWYDEGQAISEEIGRGDITKGAGIIAALSPKNEWGRNVENAREFIKSGTAHGRTSDQIEAATKIYEGMAPEDVLPMKLKTGHFYRLLKDPTDPTAVAVDTHHHDVSMGIKKPWEDPRGMKAPGRYKTFVDATIKTAHHAGILPHQAQAIDWLVWKSLPHGRITKGR